MKEETLTMENTNNISIKKTLFFLFKRGFDILCALLGLVIFSPLFLIVTILIKIESKGPAILVQKRIGKNGKEFNFYKFRSMTLNADKILSQMLENDEKLREEYHKNKKLKNDPRVTKVGKFIREYSIDELPQLVNILKGDMSLIGNRPYLPREIDDMGSYYDEIVKTKPGLTGYWQVSGRSNNDFLTRLKLEEYYSNHISLKLDIKIFFKTFYVVFKKIGAK